MLQIKRYISLSDKKGYELILINLPQRPERISFGKITILIYFILLGSILSSFIILISDPFIEFKRKLSKKK